MSSFDTWRAATMCSLLATGCAAQNDHGAAGAASCEAAIVIGLTANTDAALADIAGATGARFERGAAISDTTAAFVVRAQGADAVCAAVVERLRGDPRVRFVEPDARRSVRQEADR